MKHAATVHLLEPVELALSLDRYRDAFPSACGGFVLDGGEFAMLGAEPFLSFRAHRSAPRGGARAGVLGARVVIEERGTTMRAEVDDALDTLRVLLRENAVDPAIFQGRPLPFLAGAVGYVGYETGQMLERLPCPARPQLGLPDIALFFHDWVLGVCRRTDRAFLSVVGRGPSSTSARSEAERTRDRILTVLASFEQRTRFLSERPRARAVVPADLSLAELASLARCSPLVSRHAYLDEIATAKEHMRAGDALEICLTHRIEAPFSGDPFALWQELRRASPSPFAAFLDLPEAAIVSSSPERFLSIDAAGVVDTCPVETSRPRGATPAGDARGELDERRDALDAVRACFPPGSTTGAPKIEAMTLLEALEPIERGVYSGALGWLDFGGTVDLSVVIRTLVVKDGRAYVHVGGAIVADSDAAAEHDQTMHEARAMLAALAAFAEAPIAGDRSEPSVASSASGAASGVRTVP